MDSSPLAGRLIHPTKVAILEAMAWIGQPLSIIELAYLFEGGTHPSALVYHLRCLEEVSAVGQCSGGQSVERLGLQR